MLIFLQKKRPTTSVHISSIGCTAAGLCFIHRIRDDAENTPDFVFDREQYE